MKKYKKQEGGTLDASIIKAKPKGKYGQRIKARDYKMKNDTNKDNIVSLDEARAAADKRFENNRPRKAFKLADNDKDRTRLRSKINLGTDLKGVITSITGPYSRKPKKDSTKQEESSITHFKAKGGSLHTSKRYVRKKK